MLIEEKNHWHLTLQQLLKSCTYYLNSRANKMILSLNNSFVNLMPNLATKIRIVYNEKYQSI